MDNALLLWAQHFPTTSGAYDRTFNGGADAFVSRLSIDVAFYVDAGKQHAGKSYAIFGSITGTSPGITLSGIHIPLNVDPYTDFTIWNPGSTFFTNFNGTLNSNGEATASFNVPANLPTLPSFTLHHAYIVFDGSGKIYMASNAVPLHLK